MDNENELWAKALDKSEKLLHTLRLDEEVLFWSVVNRNRTAPDEANPKLIFANERTPAEKGRWESLCADILRLKRAQRTIHNNFDLNAYMEEQTE